MAKNAPKPLVFGRETRCNHQNNVFWSRANYCDLIFARPSTQTGPKVALWEEIATVNLTT